MTGFWINDTNVYDSSDYTLLSVNNIAYGNQNMYVYNRNVGSEGIVTLGSTPANQFSIDVKCINTEKAGMLAGKLGTSADIWIMQDVGTYGSEFCYDKCYIVDRGVSNGDNSAVVLTVTFQRTHTDWYRTIGKTKVIRELVHTFTDPGSTSSYHSLSIENLCVGASEWRWKGWTLGSTQRFEEVGLIFEYDNGIQKSVTVSTPEFLNDGIEFELRVKVDGTISARIERFDGLNIFRTDISDRVRFDDGVALLYGGKCTIKTLNKEFGTDVLYCPEKVVSPF